MGEQLFTVLGFPINAFVLITVGLLSVLVYSLWKANRDPANVFEWGHLITAVDQTTGKREASLPKMFQLVGGVVATFIVIKLTLQDKLTFDIFAIYLGYVGAINSFERLLLAKYGVAAGPPELPAPQPAPLVQVDVTNGSAKAD